MKKKIKEQDKPDTVREQGGKLNFLVFATLVKPLPSPLSRFQDDEPEMESS